MSNSTTRLRQFLLEVFSDDDLNAFCFDHFPQVYQSFTAGQTKNQRVILLIEYCRRRSKVNDLAQALKTTDPELYRAKIGDIDPAEWNVLIEQDKQLGCPIRVTLVISLGAALILFVAVVSPQSLTWWLRPYPTEIPLLPVTLSVVSVTPTRLLPVVTSTPKPPVTNTPTPTVSATPSATPVWLQGDASASLYVYADPITDLKTGTAKKGTVFYLCAFAADRYLVALGRCHVTTPIGWVDSAYLRPLFEGQFPQALITPYPTRTPRPWTSTPTPITP